jgi:uncharacterized protein (TIGR03435 family)
MSKSLMRYLPYAALALALFTPSVASAQTPPESSPQSTFDVVSIKPNNSGSGNFGGGLTSTGVHITNMSLVGIVYTAYFQEFTGNRIVGYPAWALDEHYDIVAHVDEATAALWQKLPVRQYQELARPMLQRMLADRCKLVAHLVPAQVDGYVLVVGKHGVRLTPTKPGEIYPDGALNGGDGAKVVPASASKDHAIHYYNATVEQMAKRIATNWVVQDQTNLTGRYDFVIRPQQISRDADGKPTVTDPQPYDVWDISETGLVLKRTKIPSRNLVIDHIERPTPN